VLKRAETMYDTDAERTMREVVPGTKNWRSRSNKGPVRQERRKRLAHDSEYGVQLRTHLTGMQRGPPY
jgi:hypothetical protein